MSAPISPSKSDGKPAPRNPALRDELLRRLKVDQDARFRWNKDMQNRRSITRMMAVDRENTARMKQIIRTQCWPGPSLVGKDGAQAAFILVQHADNAPDFQERCLPLIRKAADRGDVPREAVAMLTDRLLVRAGKKQIYGSAFILNAAGEWVPQPIEDEKNVDARRKRMGMVPLAEYARGLRALYGSAKKPR